MPPLNPPKNSGIMQKTKINVWNLLKFNFWIELSFDNYLIIPIFGSKGRYVEIKLFTVNIVPQTAVGPKTGEKSSGEPTNF